MALPNSTYLMRHGRYDGATGDLIVPAGYHDADNGARELQQAGLGSAALILSSTVKRARQTAQRVGGALECTVLYSDELARWGNSPEGLTDFEEMIEAELAAQSPPVRPGDIAGGLVVVTHAPMVAAAQGYGRDRMDEFAPFGHVVRYTGQWVDPATLFEF